MPGWRARAAVIAQAGGGWSDMEVVWHLHLPDVAAVDALIARGEIAWLRDPDTGCRLFPGVQFRSDAFRRDLLSVCAAFTVANGWTQWSVLVARHDALDGRSMLEALADGEVAACLEVAEAFGNTGA